MDLRDLQLFVATVEHGSILRAARAQNISQPALTRRIQNLESDLKISLIERTSRGARPTPDGMLVYERACALVNEARRLRHDVRALNQGDFGKLGVGIGIGCEAVFGSVLAGFSDSHPNIDLTVHVDFYQELVSRMRAGRLDLAFAIDPLAGPLPEFQTSYLGELVSGLACRVGHELLARDEIEMGDLAEARWAVWDTPTAARYLHGAFLKHGIGSPKIVLRSNSSAVMIAAILETDAIAVMPEYLIREHVPQERIAMLRSPLGAYVNRLVAVHPNGPHMSAAARGLVRMVREAIGGTRIGPDDLDLGYSVG